MVMLHPQSFSPIDADELEQMIATAVEARSSQIAESLAGRIAVEVESRLAGARDIDATPIELLPLSTRVRRSLRLAEVRTFGELCQLSEEELLRWRSFGLRSVAEIRRLLAWHGRHLREVRAEIAE